MTETRFFDHDGPLAFAHRGGASEAPENSMRAFEAAVAMGYRYVETDAHVTADGVVIAFHDDELDRVTDATGVVGELRWTQVCEARIDGRAPIPLLEDLLTAWPDVRVNIDAKHDEVVGPLVELVCRVRAEDRVCLASFSDRRVGEMQRLLPGTATALGSRAVARLRASSVGLPAGRFAGHCAQVPLKARGVPLATQRFVERAHRHDLQVHVWTIDEADEMDRLLDLGVDGIMTDRPAVLKQVLERRHEWA